MHKPIYLDHAATTFPEEAVIQAMNACMRASAYNAAAVYSAAGQARRVHRLCRTTLARILGCEITEIHFTSGGTEGNNQVIRSFADCHVVLSAIEHASVLEAAKAAGCSVTLVYPDKSGFVSAKAVERAIRPQTKLIALMAANNVTGVIQPMEDVYALAKARRIHLHVDAVQAFGHMPVSSAHCDSMTLSAHKCYGPRGVGALFVRSGSNVAPLLLGGQQEGGLRAGTENTPAICGFDVAAQLAREDMDSRAQREAELLHAFCAQLKANLPGIRVLGEARERLPGVCALLLPGVPAEQMIASLDLRGVLVSGGAACASSTGKPSHVYAAMGLSAEEAARVIRVSIGRHTTREELDFAAEAIEAIVRKKTFLP